MKMDLEHQVVVITGASSGIGRATAIEFAKRGANVVITARSAEGLEYTADECRAFDRRVVVHPADVTNTGDMENLARLTYDRFGKIDVWVNNAGVFALGEFENMPDEVFRRVIETNFFGVVNGTRAVLPYFRRQSHGVLINVGSEVSNFAIRYGSAYTASKFAVKAFTSAIRQELLDTDIHVCTVMPASIDTPLFQHAANFSGYAIKPARPIYTPEMVAETIADLALAPQREVFVGQAGRQLTAFYNVAPSVQERVVAKMVDEDHFEDKPATNTPGNLFEPRGPYGEEGGWRRKERMRSMTSAATNLIALAPLAASLGWIWSQNRERTSRFERREAA
jgi:short-subunit dehydrogenase